jgi:hypothetical protein
MKTMSTHSNIIRRFLHQLLALRYRMNEYLESIDDPRAESPEEKAIAYAVVAIAGLLFFGAVIIGCMVTNLI